jgi:uncharacterized protein
MRKLMHRVDQAAKIAITQIGVASYEIEPLRGSVPVVQLSFGSADRLSIYVTDAGSQLLCICYLFQESDLNAKSRTLLLETLLDLNPSVPLSNFGRIGEHFVLIGALSPNAGPEELALELSTLSDNASDALATLDGFLKRSAIPTATKTVRKARK